MKKKLCKWTGFKRLEDKISIKIYKEEEKKEYLELTKVTEFKYLGYWIDALWKHTTHIDKIIDKLKQIMPKLYAIRNVINIKNKIMLYNAWIQAHLLYAIELYGKASNKQIIRLQSIQDKMLKILFVHTKPHVTRLNNEIMNISSLSIYTCIVKNYFTLQKKLERQKNTSQLRKEHLPTPMWKNKYGKMTETYFATKCFNNLPKKLKNLNTYGSIKTEIKSYLLGITG
jgi:hypothetical protein